MPLMKSCCCFRSIRHGSFASAIYTMTFYVILMPALSFHVQEVKSHPVMLAFSIVLVCLSIVMVITSILLLIGLFAENGQLFVPWLITITLTIIATLVFAVYLLIDSVQKSTSDPFKITLAVIDFMICSLNSFCFMCVYSYFKECSRELLHLKYLTPPSNPRNDFEDLKKYDGSKDETRKQPFGDRREHLAQKNSHFVELSTISEDNEQISSEKNTTINLTDDSRRLLSIDYENDYFKNLDPHLVSSLVTHKSDVINNESIKLNTHLESVV